MVGYDLEIADPSIWHEFRDDFEAELEDAAVDIGEEFKSLVQSNIEANDQVDTGLMLSSIRFETKQIGALIIRVEVGSDVFYSEFQEDLRPFIEPAVEEIGDYAESRIEEAAERTFA